MKKSVLLLTGLVAWLAIQTAFAVTEPLQFKDAAEEKRYQNLIAELRCLVCQNQSLLDSDAELAQDLRREVYDMMKQGKSDDEIIGFLVARYSDFVLYRPPVKPSTYLLWFLPILLFVIGAILVARIIASRKQASDEETVDEERLKKLLSDNSVNK